MPLQTLANLDDAQFRRLFAGTAIKRSGRDRMVRNTAIARANASAASGSGDRPEPDDERHASRDVPETPAEP